MRKYFITWKSIGTFLFCFILYNAAAQTQRKVSTYLQFQYNKTIHDITPGNNPWGAGLGIQVFLNNNNKIKPTAELTGDLYLENDKVMRMRPDETPIDDVRGAVNLLMGASFNPSKFFYVSFLAGPAFINDRILLSIKPTLGFYFSNSQKWTGKFSYINVFNRDKITKEDFGSLSFAIGVRL